MFELNPNQREEVLVYAQRGQKDIVKVLTQLRREILLLLKVNEFARTIENLLGGRPLGVYHDIAITCVANLSLPWYVRWKYYWKMWRTNF